MRESGICILVEDITIGENEYAEVAGYFESEFMGVIEKAIPLRTFFKHRFFNNAITFPTKEVMFEFHENRHRLAPFDGTTPEGVSKSRGILLCRAQEISTPYAEQPFADS